MGVASHIFAVKTLLRPVRLATKMTDMLSFQCSFSSAIGSSCLFSYTVNWPCAKRRDISRDRKIGGKH